MHCECTIIPLSEEGVTHRNVGDCYCHLSRHPFVSQIKYIDDSLSWSPHVDSICKQVGRKIGALRRTYRQLTPTARRQFFVSVIQPDLEYAASATIPFMPTGQQDFWRSGKRPFDACNLTLSFVINPRKGLTLTRSGPVSVALIDPQRRSWKCIRRPSTLPVSQGTGGSLFPSVRATRSDTASVRLGNVKLGLDSEKKKACHLPWKYEQRKNLRC